MTLDQAHWPWSGLIGLVDVVGNGFWVGHGWLLKRYFEGLSVILQLDVWDRKRTAGNTLGKKLQLMWYLRFPQERNRTVFSLSEGSCRGNNWRESDLATGGPKWMWMDKNQFCPPFAALLVTKKGQTDRSNPLILYTGRRSRIWTADFHRVRMALSPLS